MIKKNDGISKDDICQNQFTAYVVLAVKRKRQSYMRWLLSCLNHMLAL